MGRIVLLLSVLHLAISSHGNPCQAPDSTCDFVCDCSDCSDEQQCGYRGKDFVCDFEEEQNCGWVQQSSNVAYTWERRQRGDTLPDSGPASDFTTGTATGWFMGVTAVAMDSPISAVLLSPAMKQSSATCRLRLRYFLWDSGHAGLGSAPLWASLVQLGSREAVVWRPEATSVRGWREATVFLGRVDGPFQVRLQSRRSRGHRGDVAVDHLEFLDCALPLPAAGGPCAPGQLPCQRGGCVGQEQVCDGTDDCGDSTDELSCDGYRSCDFEEDVCDWDLRTMPFLKWVRTSQENISTIDPMKGPGRDHSTNSASGHFLYVTVPDGGLSQDWASFQSPLLDPTNSTHPCKLVMYTHQFGPRSGGLTVLVADTAVYPVWERGGALGDLWVKAEVEIVTNSTFYIILMAAIRDFAYGGIAVDSLRLSHECRKSNASKPETSIPPSPKKPCAEPSKMCDFNSDCGNADDEAECGDFSYPRGSSGWTDASLGTQSWRLRNNATSKEEYLAVAEAPGQQRTEAQTRTPLLGPSGPACTLTFSFALTGDLDHIGELSVRVIDSLLGRQPKLWEFSSKTGTEESPWQQATVPIGLRKHRFQLEFEARATKLGSCDGIRVKDVHYLNCHRDYFPSSPTGMSCNFEDGLCAWYQDNSDNFDWTVLSGMDHTIGMGTSLVVNFWSSALHGASGRLLSYPQFPIPSDHCLFFFYKLYGSDTGILNVKVVSEAHEKVLWTRSGDHGNMWHEGHCPVPHQLTKFQLMFESVRSGFDGQVAIDDVAFVDRPCTLPRMCSFEGQRCGYSSTGPTRWLHSNGHAATAGPKTDHTLDTDMGYYMMVHSDVEVLPVGSSSTLSSPVRSGKAQTECLLFWYHMGGVKPGAFTVYMRPAKGERVQLFSDSLNQGDVWRHGNSNISGTLLDWQLEFEVIGAGGKDTHVAIDDITLLPHPCQNQGSRCNMEQGMCGWSNTHKVDKLDWVLTSKEAETHYSTPPTDHTLGTERGKFLLFPSSNRAPANQNAQLLSVHLTRTMGTCLKFWAHMPSSADNQLIVWRLSEDQMHQLLVVKDVDGIWKRFSVNIVSSQEYQIVLEGLKGTAGIFALDDIEYTIGINCDGEVTDPVTTKPKGDNAGGLAASIVVVMLLLGTLAALLIYYLKTRETSRQEYADGVGFTNEQYEPQGPVNIPQNQPMAAGFNDVVISGSEHVREMEVA